MGSMNAALEIEIKAAGDDLARATEATNKLNSTLRDVSAETENAAESVETHTEAVEELADAMDDATGDIILPNESDPAAQTIKRLVRQWKGAHCRCANIILQKHIDAPLVGFPRRTIGTIAQSDGTNTGGLWTQNSGWFDRASGDFADTWSMNAQ